MSIFKFKHFSILQADNAMKVGTDAMVLGAFIDVQKKSRALDIGSGTGVLALMAMQRNPYLKIDAIELDELSSKEAQVNFDLSPWTENLTALNVDFLDFEKEEKYDLIVSNPPYYQSRLENDDDRKAKARHESSLPMTKLLQKTASLMERSAHFWIIVPADDHKKWIEAANVEQLYLNSHVRVHGKSGGKHVRSILVFDLLGESTLIEKDFWIRNMDGKYSDEYKELTKDYHFVTL